MNKILNSRFIKKSLIMILNNPQERNSKSRAIISKLLLDWPGISRPRLRLCYGGVAEKWDTQDCCGIRVVCCDEDGSRFCCFAYWGECQRIFPRRTVLCAHQARGDERIGSHARRNFAHRKRIVPCRVIDSGQSVKISSEPVFFSARRAALNRE